jgi:hypothetical protein
MAEPLSYANPSDKEAKRVGSNTLDPPDEGHDLTIKDYKYDNGFETKRKTWTQLCTIDDIVPTIEKEDDSDGGLVRERARIQLRISDKVKQVNTGRVESDFCNFWWELAHYSDDQLEEWEKKAANPAATPEDKKKATWRRKMRQMNFASQSMAQLCKATGFEDRLANRSVFRGIGRIKDVIPRMISKDVRVTFQWMEDREGTPRVNIRGYKKA